MRRALLMLLAPACAFAAEFRNPVVGDAVVTAYYDLGGVRDWNCGNNTYGGHRGTDIAIIGRFEAQDAGRDVVAGAAGEVIRAHDGEFDRCTTADCPGGGGFGNHVALRHDDGKVTYYAHLRRGSVSVQQGQRVDCGQRLGQVGSSGFSTGPHLHFEVRPGGGNADDPFTGPCGGPLTYWVDQGPYRGLPSSECRGGEPPPPPPPPPPPAKPDFHLAIALELPGGRTCDFESCDDFIRDGASGGVPDAWVGEEVVLRVVVSNVGNGNTAGESEGDAAISIDYEVPAFLEATRYAIETDWPAKDRSSWSRNDAMDNPANPGEDALDRQRGNLRLNGFSGGESKRLTLFLRARGRSVDAGGHAELRAWIRHVRDYYGEKEHWDDGVERNDGQSFNGGDLKVAAALDVFDPTAFLFDAPDEAQVEGWRRCDPAAVGQMRVNRDEGAMALEVLGPNPCVEGPPVRVPLDGFRAVNMRLRQRQGARGGFLYWATEDEPVFADTRRVAFATPGGGAFADVAVAPPWYGTLTRLRLVPVDGPGDGDPWIDVGEVRLAADAPPPPPPPAGDGGVVAPPAVDGAVPAESPDGGAAPPERDAFTGGFERRADGATYDGGCVQAPGGAAGWWLLVAAGVLRRRRR
jgi:hypothetical protein